MSKTIVSPVPRFPGTVTLKDPLGLQDSLAFRRAWRESTQLDLETTLIEEVRLVLLPGISACVEKWQLDGLANPPDPFPATPGESAGLLFSWLFTEIAALYREAEIVPNA